MDDFEKLKKRDFFRPRLKWIPVFWPRRRDYYHQDPNFYDLKVLVDDVPRTILTISYSSRPSFRHISTENATNRRLRRHRQILTGGIQRAIYTKETFDLPRHRGYRRFADGGSVYGEDIREDGLRRW